MEYNKLFAPLKERDDLIIQYIEQAKPGTRNSHEIVHAAQTKNMQAPTRPRKHFRLTTTASNCMIMVTDCVPHPDHWLVKKQEKVAILGEDALIPPGETSAAAHSLMTCFHWEKSKEMWEDIFHH